MVKIGFTRAYGTSMRQTISSGMKNRFIAFGSGLGITALLQSSTAATLLMISFIKKNPVAPLCALAFVIGADVATTLVAQILTFDLSWLSPALLVIGITGHIKYEHGGRRRHIFRVMIGLGLILLSLSLIRSASLPLTDSDVLPLILAPLEFDPLAAVVFSALLTWIIHSSLASVLLFATLAGNGIIDLHLGALLILGANLGGAFIPFIASYNDGINARRITSANIFMRCLTLILAASFLPYIMDWVSRLNMPLDRQIVSLHMGFNIALAIIFMPLIPWITQLAKKLFPEIQTNVKAPHEPLYLDDRALDTPVVALAGAARETLRIADMIEQMLEQTIRTFEENNAKLAETISRKDNTVDTLYHAIKLYLTRLTQEALDPKEADRYFQILTFATNLEHIGDIIDKSLIEMAKKKIKHQERFSNEGWAEIKDFHRRVLSNMRMAHSIFLSEDPALAQRLVDGKKAIREAERATSAHHFERMRTGLPETIATTSLHLDIIRDYRRINSYITTVAYSIIENAKKYEPQRRIQTPATHNVPSGNQDI
ncbi:MAG: Na/Pi cotransporter family protein [Alphaproteobacteria bacterium]|nr:Na/Pi cotransporter family protein [Alphaproteobacteria bacterium]